MREPGSDGNLNVMFYKKFQIILENMTNRFPLIPNFAWISHALPLNSTCNRMASFFILLPCLFILGVPSDAERFLQCLVRDFRTGFVGPAGYWVSSATHDGFIL